MAGGGGNYLPRLVLLAVGLLIVSMGALYVLYDPPAALSDTGVRGTPVARGLPEREPIRARP